MLLKWLTESEIMADWPTIAEEVYRATRHDPHYSLTDLYWRVLERTALIFRASGDARGYLVITIDQDETGLVGWTTAIVGSFDGGPRQRLKKMREGLLLIENALRSGGVKKHRFCGREYEKLFPDYMPFEGVRNGLEKVL